MRTIVYSPGKLLDTFMLVVCLTVLFMVALYYAQNFMPSIGWNG